MKSSSKLVSLLSIICMLILSFTLLAQESNPFQYISPKPGSVMVSGETNIILRQSSLIDVNSLSPELIKVEGSVSGIHSGELILSDDNKTIVFNPKITFASNEEVNVLMEGVKTKTGSDIPKYSFDFKIAKAGIDQLAIDEFGEIISIADIKDRLSLKAAKVDYSLPPPTITIDSIDNPSDGYIFLATWDRNMPAQYGNFVFILDKNGAIVDSIRVDGAPYDFQVQPNGLLTYALGDYSANVPLPGEELQHIVMDETLTKVDSFKMKNGYLTDFHEFKMLPNGHVIMMSYHTIKYDMSTIVEGGQTDASLVINIIQEQDRDKNVVFEWRNIDYIPITDSDLDLTDSRINYSTLNAFDIDDDGHILASFRNHSEIMKINRLTGELMWRMGGPRGEFTFVGEHEENAPYYHSRQHNIRRRPNGNITMFDNGQFHQPPYSRAVEYSLDEVSKEATLVSEWRYPYGNIFCVTAGNAETLPNGGWFIGYGVPNPQFVKRNAVEVHPDGSKALELSLPDGILAYRAYKLPWKETIDKQSFTHFEVREGNTYSFNDETINTGVEISYNSLGAADYNEATITRIPYGPVKPEFIENVISVYPVSVTYEVYAINSQSAEFHFDLDAYPEIKEPEKTVVYHREFTGQGLFIPKPTTYDDINNELVAVINSSGEIVFGVPDTIDNNVPILYEPLNQQKLVLQDSVTVRWTGKGFYNSFNVQIAEDSDFTSILLESNTNLSDISIKGLTNNTSYYWRVNSVLGDSISDWSEVWSFEITDPYISAVSPNGGEVWTRGDVEVIRWETNVQENVYVDLLQDNSFLMALDTLPGGDQAYSWEIPTDILAGENYSVQITSESNSDLFGVSENEFTILAYHTGIEEPENQQISGNSLDQNFPNPFSEITKISYTVHKANHVNLKVYNMIGEEIFTLVNEYQDAGTYSQDFDAHQLTGGVYFYELKVGNDFVETKKMILAK